MSEINKLPVVFNGSNTAITIPAFIVPNKEQVEIVLRDAGIYDVVNVKNVDAAEEFVKASNKILKEVEKSRLDFTRILDGIKKETMTTEGALARALSPIVDGIKEEKQRQYEEAQAEKRRLHKLEEERVQAEQQEIKRKAEIAHRLVTLENNLVDQLFKQPTLADLEAFCVHARNSRLKEEIYQERTADAQAIIAKVLATKTEQAMLAIMDAEEAAIALKKRNEEARIREEEAKRQESQQLLQVARDSDIRSQVAEQSVATVKGIKVKQVPKVVDVDKIPRKYLVPDMKLIAEAFAQGLEVAGVVLVDEVGRTGR